MCSIAMPADYEMVVAARPPIYTSAATSFLSNYSCFRYASPPAPRLRIVPPSPPREMPVATPRRPCLIIRPSDSVVVNEEPEVTSPTKLKKKVVFADDKGLSLTQVRVMTEPSDCPPFWTMEFLAQVTKGVSADAAPEPWEVTFPQPASNYLEFRHRLETECVSLENVIVKEAEEVIVGTVKVKNISFEKEVFVRVTFDEWKNQEDNFCTYVQNGAGPTAAGYVLFDTFSFKIRIPPHPNARRIEFCVCFRSEGKEFWDSNGGKNYVIVKAGSKPENKLSSTTTSLSSQSALQRQTGFNMKFNDAVQAKLEAWSEFASWNHLVNDGPYW